MYYISGVQSNTVDVTDTKDNVEERIDKAEAVKLVKSGVTIYGVDRKNDSFRFKKYTKDVIKLFSLKEGTPLRIRLSKNLDYKQVIYMGYSNEGKFGFFDGEGIDSYFFLSIDFIVSKEGAMKFDFDNNDATKVATLLRLMGGK